MLQSVRLVEQWQRIEQELPEGWSDARLELTVTDAARADRAAALLGPLMPGRAGKRIRFFTAVRGAGPGPEAVRRLLELLDEEPIEGRLELLASDRATELPETHRPSLASSWEAALAELPDDWSDLYAELELTSSDHLERAALLTAPLNPGRYGGTPGLRFRVARTFGYGASPQMTLRCLRRLDEDGIPGTVRILRSLASTEPVGTQGPVWYLGGKVV